jgi:hypothetical protein
MQAGTCATYISNKPSAENPLPLLCVENNEHFVVYLTT